MANMKKIVLGLVCINVIGFLYGLLYYQEQLKEIPIALWAFVIDCPLFTILMAIIFLLSLVKIKNDAFNFIVSVGAVKYGIWTVFALTFYNEFFFSSFLFYESLFLLFAHIGLILEGIGIFGTNKPSYTVLLAAIGLFLFSDFVDYGLGVHPFLPSQDFGVVIAFTIFLSISLPLLAFQMDKRKNNPYRWNKFLSSLRKTITGPA